MKTEPSARRGPDSGSRKSARRPADFLPGRTRARGGKTAAPGRESRLRRSGPQTAPVPRPAGRLVPPKNASQAKARAKARKAKAPKVVRPPLRDRLVSRLASIDLRPRTLAAKVPFVVLVIGSLGVGLGITLWLSTDSAERSYQLGNARETNQALLQQKEALEREVLEAQSAPALAEAARDLGMIPTKDTAHLVRDPVGNWVVVGTPKPADGVPPPPLNTKLLDAKPVPPPPPPVNPVEVPVRVSPNIGGPITPAAPGPEVLVRAPDGATTLGTQHLPADGRPTAPGPAAPGPDAPDAPAVEPLPAPAAPAPGTAGEQLGPMTAATPGTAR